MGYAFKSRIEFRAKDGKEIPAYVYIELQSVYMLFVCVCTYNNINI